MVKLSYVTPWFLNWSILSNIFMILGILFSSLWSFFKNDQFLTRQCRLSKFPHTFIREQGRLCFLSLFWVIHIVSFRFRLFMIWIQFLQHVWQPAKWGLKHDRQPTWLSSGKMDFSIIAKTTPLWSIIAIIAKKAVKAKHPGCLSL